MMKLSYSESLMIKRFSTILIEPLMGHVVIL